MIFWGLQSKPSLCDVLHFETRPVKFTNVTMEHTPKSIAYLRAAYREIRLAYVRTFYVYSIYVNFFLQNSRFRGDRIQWNLLGRQSRQGEKFLPWLRPYLRVSSLFKIAESRSRHRTVGFLFISFGFTKSSAAPWRTESVSENVEKFHTLTQLSDWEGIIEICHFVFSLISICVWCRSSNYKWATGKTWAVSVAGGYYNRVIRLLRWIAHI